MTEQLGTAQSDLSRFTADFWEDKVYIGQRTFPAGYFMASLLNNDNAMISEFGLYRRELELLLDELQRGFVNRKTFEAAEQVAHEMCELVQKAEPFCYLNDTRYESGWLDYLFRDSQYEIIRAYHVFRGEQAQYSDADYGVPRRLTEKEQRIVNEGQYYLSYLTDTLRFYASLFDDGVMMHCAAREFMDALADMPRYDERHLIEKAQELFRQGYSYIENEDEHGKRKSSRLVRADVEYIALQLPGKKKRVVTARRMHFTRWIDFLIADFYEGIHSGHYPRKCAVCGRYFLIEDGRNRLYCDGLDPQDAKGRSCRQVGADRKRRQRENPGAHPVKEECRKRINTINQHRYRGKITPEFANAARRIAQDCRDRAIADAKYARTQYRKDITQEAVYAAAEKKLNR